MFSDAQLPFASINDIGRLFRRRELSPVELTRFVLARVARLNPRLNAYLTVSEEQALRDAARAESELYRGKRGKTRLDRGPLHGIPISLKDNIYTAGIRTTGGSKILRDFVPLHDAFVVTALKKAGAVFLGKTNMHEFAYGVTTNNPHFGPARNPWDLERIPGGSSGGSAAAVAAGLCYGSIGSDTGGSIRIPASLCGVVGIKPGLGRVSAEGVIPLSPTQDSVGPLARTVDDIALLLQPIFVCGKNERSLRPRQFLARRARRLRLGIPKEFILEVLSPEVESAFHSALSVLQKQGAQLRDVSVPNIQETEDAGNQIAWAKATHFHQQAGWYPKHAAEYGEDVRTRLEMGAKVTAVAYLRAREQRELFIAGFHNMLREQELDALVVPTTPITAPRIGEDSVSVSGTNHLVRALLLRLNRPANFAGVPAISVPCGISKSGLPIGLQFIGAVTDEPLLLAIASDYEKSSPLNARPDLSILE